MKPFIALYTARPDADPALLLVFANRDTQTAADVAGTRQNLEAEGEIVHVCEFDQLGLVPEVLDLSPKVTASPPPDCVQKQDGDGLTPSELINRKYTKLIQPGVYEPKSGQEAAGNGCDESYGDTYQVGVKPGAKKLAQFIEVLKLAGTPALYAQENSGEATMVYVKLFDPSGSWTWYITEFSEVAPAGVPNLAFGLVNGHQAEMGYIDLDELANVRGGMGLGIEIDMHFKPQPLKTCREQLG